VSLQHVVLFSFPDDLSPEDDAEMRRLVESWPDAIGGMTSIRLGRSINEERTRGYQYLLYTEFPDVDALVTYQKHPVHQEFLRWVLDRNCTPLAFDYHLDEQTVVFESPALSR
jgi:stress responsive alpha/beta barrel protein